MTKVDYSPALNEIERLGAKADALEKRMDAFEDVNVDKIVRRLMPKQSEADIAKVKAYVKGKLTRGGLPGETDAVGYVREWFSDHPVGRRNDAKSGINGGSLSHGSGTYNEAQRLAAAQSAEYKKQIAAGKSPKEANELAKAVKL